MPPPVVSAPAVLPKAIARARPWFAFAGLVAAVLLGVELFAAGGIGFKILIAVTGVANAVALAPRSSGRGRALATVAALAVGASLLPACATVRAVGERAAAAAEECAPDVIRAALPAFFDALLAGGDWRAVVGAVRGATRVCLMDAAIAELERRASAPQAALATGGATPLATPLWDEDAVTRLQLTRAKAWRAEH